MLGRLFSSGFGPAVALRRDAVGWAQDPPVSVLDDVDTRALLYGTGPAASRELVVDLKNDIRVVIVSDVQYLDDLLFDSDPRHRPPRDFVRGHQSSKSESLSVGRRNYCRTLASAAPAAATTAATASSSISPSPSEPILSYHGPETLRVPLLREVVFGLTPIWYGGAITKLHPFPVDPKTNKQTWMVSRVFKVGAPQSSSPSFCPEKREFKGQTAAGAESSRAAPNESWNPSRTTNCQNRGQAAQEISCAVCIYFNLPAGAQDFLPNHWTELSFAVADLQQAIYPRLAHSLPAILRSHKTKRRDGGTGLGLQDEEIARAVDGFKSRFCGALRIPRVICGQNRWPELYQELRKVCLADNSGGEATADSDGFISTMIATFLKSSPKSFQEDAQLHRSINPPGHEPGTRTVIVGDNKVAVRRHLFILTSLIHDLSAERLQSQLNFVARQNNIGTKDSRNINISIKSSKKRETTTSGEREASGSERELGPLSTERGWEIPAPKTEISESNSMCNMPHVVRPSFSSSSLSSSVNRSMKGASLDRLRRGTGWSDSFGSASTFDDLYYDTSANNSYDSHMDKGSPLRPGLSRLNSSERTATTLSLSMLDESFGSTSSGSGSGSGSSSSEISDSEVKYETIDLGDGSIGIEVDAPEYPETCLLRPIVLPPVAGHLADFHPDFSIQGCSFSKDLESKIARAMFRDAELNPPRSSRAEGSSSVVSRTIIVNLSRREIVEWTLDDSEPSISRRKLFCRSRPVTELHESSQQVLSKLRDTISKRDDEYSSVSALCNLFQHGFGLI